MNANTQFILFFPVLLFAFACSLYNYHRLTLSLKMIAILLGCTIVGESVAMWMSRHYSNNMPVYHFYAPLNLALVALYYNYALPAFRRRHIGYFIAAIGIIAAIFNTCFLQPLYEMNSNFMLLEGLSIVGMTLISFYYLYTDNTDLRMTANIHFWLAFIFLFFWCSTFLTWALLKALIIMKKQHVLKMVYMGLWLVNILMYAGIGIVFLTLGITKKKHE